MFRQSFSFFPVSILLIAVLLCAAGCETREVAGIPSLQQETCEYVLLIAIDCSGSFRDYMTVEGKGFEFVQFALDKYFGDRIGGNNDQIVITQLSGSRPLLWQGTPQELRRDFPNANAFRDYVLAHADQQGGSRLNLGVAESLDYVLSTYSVAQGNAKTVALICSDMLDNHPDPEASEQRFIDALTRYARRGAIGFYFCDQTKLADIRRKTEQAGFRWVIIEPEFHGRPPMPNFD